MEKVDKQQNPESQQKKVEIQRYQARATAAAPGNDICYLIVMNDDG